MDECISFYLSVYSVTYALIVFFYRYCLEQEDPNAYVLCDVIGRTGIAHQWQTECLRVIGDNEKPLVLQSLWKPKEGFCRRFEIHTRTKIEDRNAKDRDTITAGDPPERTGVFSLWLELILGLDSATFIQSLYLFARCIYIKQITNESESDLSSLGLRINSGYLAGL